MNPKVAEGICSTVGTVVRKFETEMNGASFMRVRVNVDVTNPLSRGRMVSFGQSTEKWVFSSMSAYLISATGAAVLTMTIGTVRCGLIVKVP